MQLPRMAGVLKSIETKYAGSVRVLYRHFPIPGHAEATTAALAAECANNAGMFRKFHDVLFAAQDSIGRIAWTTFADRAGITDTLAFSSCVTQAIYSGRLRADVEAARRLGVRGTPTVLVNEWNVGANPERLEEIIAREIRASR